MPAADSLLLGISDLIYPFIQAAVFEQPFGSNMILEAIIKIMDEIYNYRERHKIVHRRFEQVSRSGRPS